VTSGARLAVLGSLNMDITVDVDHLPAPGETILGGAARFAPGGKGANQAVAAARLLGTGTLAMAGCVGDDAFGAQLEAALRAEGIDTTGVRKLPGTASGVAMITVDATGENVITVAPGANAQVGEQELTSAITTRPDVLVISAEIPLETIRAVLAKDTVGITVLNLAPAPRQAESLIAEGVDWLVVNETEAATVLGHPVDGLAEAAKAAAALTALGPRNAVVTIGAAGAAMAGARGIEMVPGFSVHAVDSVGAGDTFVGALAVALAAGIAPAEAVRAASAAGATAATRPGAQSGMPHPVDIEPVTGYRWPVG
jgi:ribokinase